MGVNNSSGVVRNANRVVRLIRSRMSSVVVRGQLGPGTERDRELADNSMWAHHRPL